MPVLTMNPTLGDLLKREYDRHYCREAATLLSGQNLKIGAMLGAVEVDTSDVTVAAAAGNSGNGVFTKDPTTPVLAGAQVGVYTVVCVEPATDAGTFAVYDPAGVFIGRHTVAGAAFATQIKFTIADGGNNFVAGDYFTVTVAAGTGKLKQLAYAAQADGSHRFAGVLLEDKDATGGDASVLVLKRGPAIVSADRLVWHADFDSAGKKATPLAAMKAAGILTAVTA